MFANYFSTNCGNCFRLFPDMIRDCKECKKSNAESVEVIELGKGLFGDKAVIAHKDGRIETVPASSIVLDLE